MENFAGPRLRQFQFRLDAAPSTRISARDKGLKVLWRSSECVCCYCQL